LGATDLVVRLAIGDVAVGSLPPLNIAVSAQAVFLPAGGDWVTAVFPVAPGFLVPARGTVMEALTNAGELRIMHNPAATGYTDTVENMVKNRFFDPLTMFKTTLTRGGQFEATEPYTRVYCWLDPTYYPTLVDIAKLVDTSGWDLSWDWTSGSGVSTAQDMLTWTKPLFGGQVVNAQSLSQMTTPQDPSAFGFGLEVSDHDPWFGEKMYGHGGENPGVVVRWLYYPDSGRTIFLVLNRFDSYAPAQMDASQAADSILSGVSSILLSASQ
jgi:hypothetical protein